MVMEAQEDAIENPIVNIETPANEKDNDPESDTSDQSKQYIRGWRLYTITAWYASVVSILLSTD